jgi:hypothetical protein
MKKPQNVNGGVKRPQNPNNAGGSQGSLFSKYFSRFSHAAAHATGTPAAFLIAALTILVWAVTGPLFHYSDTWQLVINTGTTIVTFLMVFLIQNTQNRDTMALQLKLAELIIAMKGAKKHYRHRRISHRGGAGAASQGAVRSSRRGKRGANQPPGARLNVAATRRPLVTRLRRAQIRGVVQDEVLRRLSDALSTPG